MARLRDIILIGSISIDRIMNFRGRYRDLIQADKLHVLSLSILIDSLTHSRGGVAANIAYSLALLGYRPTLLASIGADGRDYVKDLDTMGINTEYVYISDKPTSTFTVLTDAEDNQVGGFYPGAMSDSQTLSLDPWKGSDALVVVSAYDPATMQRLIADSVKHNLELVYDIGQQVTNVPVEDLKAGIQAARVLILNDYELGVLTKRTGFSEKTIKKTVPIVITTLGAQGCIAEGTSVPKPITVSAVPRLQTIDPTGAGDAFRSGFLYGLIHSFELPICMRMGSVAASYTIELHGTQTHQFTIREFCQRYQDTYKEDIWPMITK